MYQRQGENDKAEEYFEKALDSDPENPNAKFNLQEINQEELNSQPNLNSIMELMKLSYQIKLSVDEGDERSAKKYAEQAIILYENEIKSIMPDSPEKRKIAKDIELVKQEFKIGEYAKPSFGGGCLIATATYGSTSP